MADVRKQAGVRQATQGQFAKPGVQYPTPDTVNDFVVVERKTVDSKEQPSAYGTPHPSIPTAKLVNQTYEGDEDGKKTRTRVYAHYGTTAQQDVTNRALRYANDATSDTIIIRTYTMAESDYSRISTGTADSVVPECVLVSEQADPHPEFKDWFTVTRIFEKIPGTALSGQVVTQEGQSATFTTRTVLPSTTVTPSALLVSGSVKPNGAGKSVLETVIVPSVFPETKKSVEKPDLMPAKFKGAVPTTTQSEVSTGTVTTVSLGTGELSKSEDQITVFKKRVTTSARSAVTLPVTITETKITPEGQIAIVSQVLNTEASTLALSTSALILDGQIDKLGDGNAIRTEVTVTEVFPNHQITVRKDVQIPDRFLDSAAKIEIASTYAGSTLPADASTLTGNQVAKTTEQVDANKLRVVISELPISSTPSLSTQKLTGEHGGAVASVVETLGSSTQSADFGFKVIASNVEHVGGGSTIKTTVTLPSTAELYGQEYDDNLGCAIGYTQQVVASSTAAANTSLYSTAEIRPIDQWHSLVRTISSTSYAHLSTWERSYSAQPRIDMPNVLESAIVHYSASGDNGAGSGFGSNINCSATGSITIDADMEIRIREGYRGPVSGSTVEFFVPPGGNARAICSARYGAGAWPTWVEHSQSVVIHSESKSARVTFSLSNNERSQSSDRGSNHRIRVQNIPACLHGDLDITSDIYTTGDVQAVSSTASAFTYKVVAHAGIDSVVAVYVPSTSTTVLSTITVHSSTIEAVATGFHSPAALTSNMPTSWPAIVVQDLDVQTYKFEWAKAKAILVDLTPYNPGV